jgi:predicted ABC-type ATPase
MTVPVARTADKVGNKIVKTSNQLRKLQSTQKIVKTSKRQMKNQKSINFKPIQSKKNSLKVVWSKRVTNLLYHLIILLLRP